VNGKDHARMRRVIDSNCALRRENRKLRATLARVEALCDEHDHAVVGHCWRAVEKIRAALIEGGGRG
jgi:regulator of replication initiation timing